MIKTILCSKIIYLNILKVWQLLTKKLNINVLNYLRNKLKKKQRKLNNLMKEKITSRNQFLRKCAQQKKKRTNNYNNSNNNNK